MSVCPTFSVLRFYGWCHPCLITFTSFSHLFSKLANRHAIYDREAYKGKAERVMCDVIEIRLKKRRMIGDVGKETTKKR